MEFFRRRQIAANPIDLGALTVEGQQERRASDRVFFEDRLPRKIAPPRPIQDEVVL